MTRKDAVAWYGRIGLIVVAFALVGGVGRRPCCRRCGHLSWLLLNADRFLMRSAPRPGMDPPTPAAWRKPCSVVFSAELRGRLEASRMRETGSLSQNLMRIGRVGR